MTLSGFQSVNKKWQIIIASMHNSKKILKEMNAGKMLEN